jgi:2-oxo-3-hexenedioate decarboxylase
MSIQTNEASTLSAADLARWADELEGAARERREIEPITARAPSFTVADGYAVQEELIRRRVQAGDRVIGVKLGLTSKAKQQQMNVDEPCYGVLLASGSQPIEEPVAVADLIHPRVEPEIVFHLRDRLAGPGVTAVDVLGATEAVGGGFEVIDSRYAAFKFTLADVVADNTSAARFVLGPRWVSPQDIPNLALVGCVLEADGQPVTTAAGAAVLGHPAAAVALLANWLGSRGRAIEPGAIVLSGGLTDAVPLTPGRHVTASFGRLGSLTLRAV